MHVSHLNLYHILGIMSNKLPLNIRIIHVLSIKYSHRQSCHEANEAVFTMFRSIRHNLISHKVKKSVGWHDFQVC